MGSKSAWVQSKGGLTLGRAGNGKVRFLAKVRSLGQALQRLAEHDLPELSGMGRLHGHQIPRKFTPLPQRAGAATTCSK